VKKPHHRFPQTLISFQHLEGGVYGTLAIIARDRDTIEVQLGNDFVRMNADGASQIAQALEMFAGTPPELVVEVEEETEEREVVEAPLSEEPRLTRARRAPRRRQPA
jgi:hypothetical protein